MLVLWLAAVAAASPQVEVGQHDGTRIWGSFAWDPAWVAEVGVARSIRPPGDLATLRGEIALRVPPALLPRLAGLGVEGGLEGRIGARDRRAWALGLGASGWIVGAGSDLGAQLGVGTDLRVRPGLYAPGWTVAADLGWHQAWLGWLGHRDAVVDLFGDRPDGAIPGPRRGVFALTATRLRAGIGVAARLAPPLIVALGGGIEWTPATLGVFANPALGQLPFTTHVTVEVRP